LYVNTEGTALVPFSDAEISAKVNEIIDMRPAAIERRLKLRNPMYLETATYGHVGRTPRTVTKQFTDAFGKPFTREVELFTWEKLDYVAPLRAAFSL
jgi:S-adenosylmethionine synthetase